MKSSRLQLRGYLPSVPVLALASMCWLVSGQGWTQPVEVQKDGRLAPPQPKQPATAMKVFQAKHAKARDLAKTIAQIWGQTAGKTFRVSEDERTNSVIVVAAPEELDQIEALASRLDRAASDTPRPAPQVIPLTHIRADSNLRSAVSLVVANRGSSMVYPERNLVVVTGDLTVIQEVQELLGRLDRPLERSKIAEVQVRLVWLASGLENKDARKPPEDMKGVVTELSKMGIENPRRRVSCADCPGGALVGASRDAARAGSGQAALPRPAAPATSRP